MNQGAKRGFTLVELMLSMAFISVLLLAIAMTIMQIGAAYNRGMTVKEVNQAARLISEDLRYNIAASSSFSFDGSSFLVVRSGSVEVGARLCLGTYSYVWNYGRAFETSGATITRYQTVPTGRSSDVRFVRVNDSTKAYCQKQTNNDNPLHPNIRSADAPSSQELLKVGDRNLAVQRMEISSTEAMYDGVTGQRLYEVIFTLGAGSITAMNSTQTACLPAGTANADVAYCVVQNFPLVIRAGNGVN